jgi:polyisoprenoid-binding protein YceI
MKKLLLTIGFLATISVVGAQEYTLRKSGSECAVNGTSTLHDWTLDAEELTGKASVSLKDGKVENIDQLSFEVKVEGLKSHKSGMDKNTYKALKSDQHPSISYQFARVISITDASNGQLIKTGGKLTIAGVTKSVYLDVTAKTTDGISFEGSTTFKMSDYGVEPPIALMGTIKTGDEVTIKFNVKYAK